MPRDWRWSTIETDFDWLIREHVLNWREAYLLRRYETQYRAGRRDGPRGAALTRFYGAWDKRRYVVKALSGQRGEIWRRAAVMWVCNCFARRYITWGEEAEWKTRIKDLVHRHISSLRFTIDVRLRALKAADGNELTEEFGKSWSLLNAITRRASETDAGWVSNNPELNDVLVSLLREDVVAQEGGFVTGFKNNRPAALLEGEKGYSQAVSRLHRIARRAVKSIESGGEVGDEEMNIVWALWVANVVDFLEEKNLLDEVAGQFLGRAGEVEKKAMWRAIGNAKSRAFENQTRLDAQQGRPDEVDLCLIREEEARCEKGEEAEKLQRGMERRQEEFALWAARICALREASENKSLISEVEHDDAEDGRSVFATAEEVIMGAVGGCSLKEIADVRNLELEGVEDLLKKVTSIQRWKSAPGVGPKKIGQVYLNGCVDLQETAHHTLPFSNPEDLKALDREISKELYKEMMELHDDELRKEPRKKLSALIKETKTLNEILRGKELCGKELDSVSMSAQGKLRKVFCCDEKIRNILGMELEEAFPEKQLFVGKVRNEKRLQWNVLGDAYWQVAVNCANMEVKKVMWEGMTKGGRDKAIEKIWKILAKKIEFLESVRNGRKGPESQEHYRLVLLASAGADFTTIASVLGVPEGSLPEGLANSVEEAEKWGVLEMLAALFRPENKIEGHFQSLANCWRRS